MKLDLGCGDRRHDDFVGIDRIPSTATQIVADITKLPLREGCATEILLDNVVEHVADIAALMREIARVAEDGARIVVVTPHFTSWASWRDPTHLHHLSWFSMDHFDRGWVARQVGARLRVTRRRLSFGGGPLGIIGRILFALSPRAWEKHWCFVFRASTLRFELVVDKSGNAGRREQAGQNTRSPQAPQ